MIIQKEINGKFYRFYTIKENNITYYLPSISTLSSVFQPKYGLYKWRKTIGEKEADLITKVAADRGTILHKYCEQKDNNLISFNDSGFAEIFDLYIRDNIEILSAEKEVHYIDKVNQNGFAGRYDLIVNYQNNLYVGDYKFTTKIKTPSQIGHYCLQLAGYSLAIEYTEDIYLTKALLINISDNDYRMYEIELSEYRQLFIKISNIYEQYLRETDKDKKYSIFNWNSVTDLAKTNIRIIDKKND